MIAVSRRKTIVAYNINPVVAHGVYRELNREFLYLLYQEVFV